MLAHDAGAEESIPLRVDGFFQQDALAIERDIAQSFILRRARAVISVRR